MDEASSAVKAAERRDEASSAGSSHAEKKASRRNTAWTGLQIGDRTARGCSSYARAAGRTVAYGGDKEIVRHVPASGVLPSRREDTVAAPGAGELGLEGDDKKRGNRCSAEAAAQEGKRVKKKRASAAEASRPEHEKELINRLDMAVANKNAMAAIGGKMPSFVRLAAEKEATKAAAPRMQAIARMMNRMAEGAVPAPSRAPVQRRPRPRPQPQPQTNPKPQPQPQPDRSCPRCHMNTGTVASHHLCKCVRCSETTDSCPYCLLAALPKIDCPRGMCPSCGRRAGKLALDHLCSCDSCDDCPMCDLVKLPRPLPRWNGACPCCLQNAGNASSHLCLCLKCRLVPNSACPFCALSEAPSAVKPFDSIRIIAYSLK